MLALILCAAAVGLSSGGLLNTEIKGLISYNYPQYSIGENEKGEVSIVSGNIQEFALVDALNGEPGAISFQSVRKPGHYLRHAYGLGFLHSDDGSELFKNDASFIVRKDKFYKGFSAFESCNYRGAFLRHQGYRIKLHWEGSDELYKMDASFLLATVALHVKFESKNYPGYYWGVVGDIARITSSHDITVQLVMPGLTGDEDTCSFYVPGHSEASKYLRHRGYTLRAEQPSTVKPDLYRKDATFKFHQGKWFDGYVSLESVNYPNHFIRHSEYILSIRQSDGSELYKNDASFSLSIPSTYSEV